MGFEDFGGAAAMTDHQVDAVGDEFAAAYYAAMVRSGTAAAELRAVYGTRSDHLFLARGRLDIAARGPEAVERLFARMEYGRCSVHRRSVDTIRVRANRFAVLVVGDMTRPGRTPEVRKFVQSTVVNFVRNKFTVVGTVFMFDDAYFDDEVADCDYSNCSETMTSSLRTENPADTATTTGSRGPVSPAAAGHASSVHVARLPDAYLDEDLRTEFGRFGKVIGARVALGPKRKGWSKRYLYGTVWYDNPGTVDVIDLSGTVTLADGQVVVVRRSTKPSPLPNHRSC